MINIKEENCNRGRTCWFAANNKLKKGDAGEAIKLYTEALDYIDNDTCTNPSSVDIRTSRSEAFFLEKRYYKAFTDAVVVMGRNPDDIKNVERATQCCLFLGKTKLVKLCLLKIPHGEGRDQELKSFSDKLKQLEELKEKVEKLYAVKDFKYVLDLVDEAIAIAPSAIFFIDMKAKCLFYQQKNMGDLFKGIDSKDALDYALALRYYCEGNLYRAILYFQEARKVITEATMWLKRVSFMRRVRLTKYDLQQFGGGQPGGDLFNEEIDFIPAILNNRAAFRSIRENYKEALDDVKEVLKIVPGQREALVKCVQCYLALGDLKEATAMLNLIRDPVIRNANVVKLEEKLEEVEEQHILIIDLMNQECYDRAIGHIALAQKAYPKNLTLVLLHAECLAVQMKIPQAERLLQSINSDLIARNAHFYFVKGLCYYKKNELRDANKKFTKSKLLASENRLQFSRVLSKATSFELKSLGMIQVVENAELERKRGNKQKALAHYTSALSLDTRNEKYMIQVHLSRAEVYKDMKKYTPALYDCEKAIEIKPDCSEAWSGKGKVHMEMGNFKAAVDDFEEACKLAMNIENRSNLSRARKMLKTGEKRSHYDILGISQNASDSQIKNAYYLKAKEFHPDKHMNAEEEERQKIEAMMKNVTAAQRCLSDPVQKRKYDSKLDSEEDDDRDEGYNRWGYW